VNLQQLDIISGQTFFTAVDYLRPEQTIHSASRKFYKNEVFKTEGSNEHLSSEAVGKCFVLHIQDATKGIPVAAEGNLDNIYLCESRYLASKKMDRIKNWKACQPEQIRDVELELEAPPEPLNLNKEFPSPFASQEEDAMDVDEEDTESAPESDDGSEYGGEQQGRRVCDIYLLQL